MLPGITLTDSRPNQRWALHRSSSWGRTAKKQGVGRIQIWQAKSLVSVKAESQPPSVLGSSARQSRADSIHSNNTMASTLRPRPRIPMPAPGAGTAVALQRPALPMLVVFTEMNKRPTILALKRMLTPSSTETRRERRCRLTRTVVDPSIEIHFPSCDCGSQKEIKQAECCRTVLECNPPKREKFTIFQLSAEDSTNLSSWNIALFGQPSHPDFDQVEALKGVKWLSLDGETPQERAELQTSLEIMSKIRDRQQREYDSQESMISRRADRPIGRQVRETPMRTRRASSVMSSPSLASQSSKLG